MRPGLVTLLVASFAVALIADGVLLAALVNERRMPLQVGMNVFVAGLAICLAIGVVGIRIHGRRGNYLLLPPLPALVVLVFFALTFAPCKDKGICL